MKKTTALAFIAGLFGGIAAQYLKPQSVHAESFPKELRAHSFVLVNQQGSVLGTFAEEEGRPVLRLLDGSREIWSAGGKLIPRSAAVGK